MSAIAHANMQPESAVIIGASWLTTGLKDVVDQSFVVFDAAETDTGCLHGRDGTIWLLKHSCVEILLRALHKIAQVQRERTLHL